ncbi:MAG TPA: ABC transporter permease [Limnochordia bacterium]
MSARTAAWVIVQAAIAALVGASLLCGSAWLHGGLVRDLGTPLTAVGRQRLWSEGSFDAEALRAVASIPGIAAVAPVLREGVGTIVPQSGRPVPRPLIRWATVPAFQQVAGLRLAAGRFLVPSDLAAQRRVAVLTEEAATLLFPGRDPIGRSVEVGGEIWSVVGIVETPRLTGTLGLWLAGERVTDAPGLIVPLSAVVGDQPDPRVTAIYVQPALGPRPGGREAGEQVAEVAGRMATVLARWAGDDEPYLVRGGDIEPWSAAGRVLARTLQVVAGLGGLLLAVAAARAGWAAAEAAWAAGWPGVWCGLVAGGAVVGVGAVGGTAAAVLLAVRTGWPIAYTFEPAGAALVACLAAAAAARLAVGRARSRTRGAAWRQRGAAMAAVGNLSARAE